MISKIIFAFILFIFILIQTCFSQQYNFHSYSIDKGLSQSQVYACTKDEQGYLWFGTDGGGISKFDGIGFVEYTQNNGLSNNQIRALHFDKQNNLWVGTKDGGLNRFNGSIFEHFDKSSGIPATTILCLEETENNKILIGTKDYGLFCFEDNYFHKIKLTENDTINISINTVSVIHDVIYVGTQYNGIYVIKNDKVIEHYNTNNGLRNNAVHSISFFNDVIYIGTEQGLQILIPYKKQIIECGLELSLLKNAFITQLLPKKNILTIATFGQGVFQYNTINNKLYIFDEQSGMPNNFVHCLLYDRNKILWIGTDGSGLVKYSGDLFRHLNVKDGLSTNIIMAILEDKNNNIWLATYGKGIDLYSNGKYINYSKKNGLVGNIVYDVFEASNGDIYIGTKGSGFSIYRNGIFTNYTTKDGLASNYIYAFEEDKNGIIWIAARDGGINLFDGEKFVTINKEKGLSSEVVYDLYKDSKGNIWIANDETGADCILNSFDTKEYFDTQVLKSKHINKYNINNGLCFNQLLSITEDSLGQIVFGTFGNGICFYDGKSFTNINKTNGLNSNYVYLLHTDKSGIVWVGTERGLNKLVYDKNKQKYDIYNYSKAEGFTGIETNLNAVCESKTGEIWFGSIGGVTIYNPLSDTLDKTEPLVHLSDIKLFYRTIDWQKYSNKITKWTNMPINLELPYNQNHLTFHFSGIWYKNPEQIEYKWKLEGFDKQWTPATNQRQIIYSNIPPGKYTLKLKVRTPDIDFIEQKEMFSFEIHAPFWQKWWFYLFSVLIITLLLWFLIKRREKKLAQEKIYLKEQVDLQTIKLQAERDKIAKQNEKIIKQKEEVEKLSIVAREIDNSVIICDLHGKVEWINDAYTRLYGYTLDNLYSNFGQNIVDISTNDNIKKYLDRCIKYKMPTVYYTQTQTQGNLEIWVQTTLNPILDNNDKIRKIIAIETDITKIKQAEEELIMRAEEIEAQRNEIEKQKDKLERKQLILEYAIEKLESKNQQITDSIIYAKRIQNAILPSKKYIDNVLPNSFIYYKPKDIVSGDFYWIKEIKNKVYVAAVDCTGHGVPGAFMSLIGYNLLETVTLIEQNLSAGKILDFLKYEVINRLTSEKSKNKMNDGMDIALVIIHKDTQILEFAGAYNPLFITRNNELIEIKGNKFPVGRYLKDIDIPFDTHKIPYQENDIFYIFSDGYKDQLGGNSLEKFFSSRFKKLIAEISSKPLTEQTKALDKTMEEWMGDNEQCDDMIIIGVKLIS